MEIQITKASLSEILAMQRAIDKGITYACYLRKWIETGELPDIPIDDNGYVTLFINILHTQLIGFINEFKDGHFITVKGKTYRLTEEKDLDDLIKCKKEE